jgi:hypothetical protein
MCWIKVEGGRQCLIKYIFPRWAASRQRILAGAYSSQLLQYLHRPRLPEFDDLTIIALFSRYSVAACKADTEADPTSYLITITKRSNTWTYMVRLRNQEAICRLKPYPLHTGEHLHLRAVLQHHASRSFRGLCTIFGFVHPDFSCCRSSTRPVP